MLKFIHESHRLYAVRSPPSLVTSFGQKILFQPWNSLTLHCMATGSPSPS